MLKCSRCGNELDFLSGCCYCRKAFCLTHIFPEQHQCPRLSQELVFWRKKITKTRRVNASFLTALTVFLVVCAIFTSYPSRSKALRNPSYPEMLEFLSTDQTDKDEYVLGKYTCVNFAADLKNNALNAGFNCGYVVIFFQPINFSHAVNCFNTTDFGLIFIEPQEDSIVTLSIGQQYWDRTKHTAYYYNQQVYNDTITGVLITW